MARMKIAGQGVVSRSALSRAEILDLQDKLSIEQSTGKRDYGFGPPISVTLYEERGDLIYVPRWWAARNLNVPWDDATTLGSPAGFVFDLPLIAFQEEAIEQFMDALETPEGQFGGILQCGCGGGKTVMGLNLAARLGRTTLILVHKTFLLEQWIERIQDFLGLDRSEIGVIHQDKCEWDQPIVVAMIESLACREDYPVELFDAFGVIITDEVHRLAAPTWSPVISRFTAAIRIGLTATPRRGDGLWNVVRFHLGEILVEAQYEGLKAKVFTVETDFRLDTKYYVKYGTDGHTIVKMWLSRLTNYLSRDGARNVLITDELVKAIQSGRRVLVLSDRRAHLEELERLFNVRWDEVGDDDRTVDTLAGPSVRIGYLVGGSKKGAVQLSRGCNLLFGTYQYANEGLDDQSLDTLFLSTPKSDVEQAIGRILRILPDKKRPVIVDFVDPHIDHCYSQYRKRVDFYEEQGFDVKSVEVASCR